MAQSILSMKGIGKKFSTVTVLDHVDFELYAGEVHALMGENGAGKSTLMKILSGVYQPSEGEIVLRGKAVTLQNPLEAQKHGIAIIHQEFNLFPNLSVAENIFLDREAFTTAFGRIRWPPLYKKAEELLRSIGGQIDVRQEVQYLSVHNRQIVEIAKALSFQAGILIMDEPSAALPESEVQKMFDVVRRLKEQGVAIVYVSHRMKEVLQIADRVTILRDGKKIATQPISVFTEGQLINMLVGREVGELYPRRKNVISEESILLVKDLVLDEKHKVSFKLRKGEILGLFGLLGAGTHTVAERLFGLRKGRGTVILHDQTTEIKSPEDATSHKLAYVPPDRHRQGLIKQMNVKSNITLSILKKVTDKFFLREDWEQAISQSYIEKMQIKTRDEKQIVDLLSGGNQQKVVLAKWLASEPEILILEEPTRGVDVGAKSEIYQLITELAERGLSIILISSEMPEVIGMSDRILVMYRGEIVGEYERGSVDQQMLLRSASNAGDERKENYDKASYLP
jgi:ABC-type sugar transport system ATPase subunit